MPRSNRLWLITILSIGIFIAGCVPASEPVIIPTNLPPTPALARVEPTARPTATAVQLLPTWTPEPTATSFAFDFGSESSGVGPSNFPPGVNPLTGLTVSDPSLLERRPMVIKVTNFPRRVRPQWGLMKADHIFEYYLEDGMTRFVGIFYGQDASRVGPIRSARPFDEHLIRIYKGFFVFGFADDRVYEPLAASDLGDYLVIERPGNCPPMCRIGPDSDYNTLYTDTAALSQYLSDKGIDNQRQNLDGLRFVESPAVGGGEADYVFIRYSRTSYHMWTYDPQANRYLRSQDGDSRDLGEEIYQPLYDSLTEERLAADNLIILLVPTTYFYKSNSTEIYDIQLKYSGRAYALRDGRLFKLVWNRPKEGSLVTLTFENGNSFPLKPGNVWYEVLSDASTLHTEPGGVWSFRFDLNMDP